MAEVFGPDQELASRAERLRRAQEALAKIRRSEPQLRKDLELPVIGPLFPGQYVALAQADSDSYYNSPEARAVEFAEKSFEQGVEDHPANQYRRIMEDAQGVKAPELSDWDWFRQNPGFMTAKPRTDEERLQNARLDFILRRVHEAQQGRGAYDPMSWANYNGPESERMDSLAAMAAEAYGVGGQAGNHAILEKLRSPYTHRQVFQDERGDMLPWYDRESGHYPIMAEGAGLGASAFAHAKWLKPILAVNAMATAHNAAIPASQQLYGGNVGGAMDVLARAPLGVLNPEYAPGRPGGAYDWRPGVPSELVTGADTAAEILPWLVATPRFGRSRIPQLARQVKRWSDLSAAELAEARKVHGALSRKYHPDLIGGDGAIQRRLNDLFESGDLPGLRSFAP